MNDYYKKKAKANEELIACWCWVVAALAIFAVCVAVPKLVLVCFIVLAVCRGYRRYHGM